MCTADCLNTPIKILLAVFIVYATLITFMYSMQVREIRPRKYGYGVKRNNKYIVQWTNSCAPFNFMGAGNSAFIKNKCKYTNCYVTDNATGINEKDFDAIAFNGRDVIKMNMSQIPTSRSPRQKYIFAATESADRFPVCHKMFDSFFNWTWTDSIYDREGREIGPATDMKWPEMNPVSQELKLELSQKSKTAAWFVSHCRTDSKREDFVDKVNKELKKYHRHVDIYGSCGKLKCPRSEKCDKMVNKYYFYFALENSFAEDYVTDKLLIALNNNAVPVVFGSANYSRFLPDGSYLDGRKLGPKKLARVMNELIADKPRYYEFFRWRNHFTYALTTANKDTCKLCEALNNEQMVKTYSVWKDFRKCLVKKLVFQVVEPV